MISPELNNASLVFPFEDLIFDIQVYILSAFVSSGDLYTLSLVSKNIDILARPVLYRDIRLLPGLKFHNVGSHVAGNFTRTLMSSQHAFGEEILAHSSRARDVRRLEWQMCSFEDTCAHVLTDIFPKLLNVGIIHLIDMHPTTMKELILAIPPLFPRVYDATFRGVTYFPFIMPILHSPHQLSSLTLDTVNPHSVAIRLLQWITDTSLPSLKSLSFRTTLALDGEREDELLEGWRNALSAVRDTVKEVMLGLVAQPTRFVSADERLQFSAKFITVVQPVFSELKWPRLNQVQLQGIDIDSLDMLSARGLKGVASKFNIDSTIPKVQWVWKPDISNTC